ncbi:alginate lyase family protein [Mucilaginibacter sp. CSA2-8R]|uniref:alginate lyase family protein n=1 Tax=Mucilaginibacter sp. CSA2-8R TaxID=3141542 RepID=UPI00315C4ECE
MKKLFIMLSLLMTVAGARAQYVSLTATEVKALKKALETDTKVKQTYAPLKKLAEKSLQENPNPIKKVTSQGLLEGNPAKTASLNAVLDGPKIYAMALYYRLFNDKAYLNKAQQYLSEWAKINEATGDPIDETKMEDFFTGYDLIRDELSSEQRKDIDAWMESIALAQLSSPSANPDRSTSKNNWNSHRIKVITQVVYTIHADKYRDTINKLIEKQLNQNLYADGSGYDFAERDALHYHIYTLEPLLKAFIVINRAKGVNYYTVQATNTASVKKSVGFLLPFMTGEKTHGEFTNSRVKFDRDRAANGEKGYVTGHLFDPKSGIVVLSLAAYFDPSLLKIIQQVGGADYDDWQLVLNQVRKPIRARNR